MRLQVTKHSGEMHGGLALNVRAGHQAEIADRLVGLESRGEILKVAAIVLA